MRHIFNTGKLYKNITFFFEILSILLSLLMNE